MHSRSSHDRQLWLKLHAFSYDLRMDISSPELGAFEAAAAGNAILALVVATDGPAYRKAGAAMAFLPSGARVGSLSSGCIEGDLALHAAAAAQDGRVRHLQYGAGSDWVDLRLPCGGGMDVLVLPHPDGAVLATALDMTRGRVRQPVEIRIELESGLMGARPLDWNEALADPNAVLSTDVFTMTLLPELRFEIHGAGPEAAAFVRITNACGYDQRLHSSDQSASAANPDARGVAMPEFCADDIDPRTAIVLFFHDHDLEPPILAGALASRAFWVGAQGSQAAAAKRRAALAAAGVPPSQIARLHGPMGLIPSARDSRTLAISVLAEILDTARGGRNG